MWFLFVSLETGQYWRYHLSEEALRGSRKHLKLQDSTSLNALELLGMVMSEYILVVVCSKRPVEDMNCVLLQGDNEAEEHCVRHSRRGKEHRSGPLMCLSGSGRAGGLLICWLSPRCGRLQRYS